MDARDLAATVQEAHERVQRIRHSRAIPTIGDFEVLIAALAALEKQAADAQAERDAFAAAIVQTTADATERAVRAEEALRQARGLLSEWHTLGHVSGGGYNGTLHGQTLRVIAEADEALAAAGADTPPEET